MGGGQNGRPVERQAHLVPPWPPGTSDAAQSAERLPHDNQGSVWLFFVRRTHQPERSVRRVPESYKARSVKPCLRRCRRRGPALAAMIKLDFAGGVKTSSSAGPCMVRSVTCCSRQPLAGSDTISRGGLGGILDDTRIGTGRPGQLIAAYHRTDEASPAKARIAGHPRF